MLTSKSRIRVHGRNKLPPLAKVVVQRNQGILLGRLLAKNLQFTRKRENMKHSRNVVPAYHSTIKPYRINLKRATDKDLEYLKINDVANLHEYPWLENLKHHVQTDKHDMFGVCPACFHMRGPHFHYLAPVRIGGGYTIYHKTAFKPIGVGGKINWNTVKWLNSNEKQKFYFEADVRSMTSGDKYLVELFHDFVEKGGDTLALQEYLESNFDSSILEEFKKSGVDVKLITNYSELLREHVKNKIKANVGTQKNIIQTQSKEIFLATCFVEIEDSGADLDMLLVLLNYGPKCNEIAEYMKSGGNVELLEHSVENLLARIKESKEVFEKQEVENDSAIKETIAIELNRFIRHESEHRNAKIFINYLAAGGNLVTLKQFASKNSSNMLSHREIKLMNTVVDMFPNRSKLIREIDKFVLHNFKIYTAAEIIQRYLKKGGDIDALKDYVGNECSFSPPNVQSFVQKGGNVIMLQEVGGQIHSDKDLRSLLESFPSDPDLLEAYFRQGGEMKVLLNAISNMQGKENLNAYIWRRVSHAQTRSKVRNNYYSGKLNIHTPVDGRSNFKGFQPSITSYENRVYSKIFALAQAEYYYDKHVLLEDLLNEREGDVLSATVSSNRDSMTFANGSNPYLIPLWLKQKGITVASVSTATGKRRERLWKPPPAFQIKKSDAKLTRASSPFSHDRKYNLGALSESNILEIEKRERTNLSFIKSKLSPKSEPAKQRRRDLNNHPVLPPINVIDVEEDVKQNKEVAEELPESVEKSRSRRSQRDKLKRIRQERIVRSSASIRSTSRPTSHASTDNSPDQFYVSDRDLASTNLQSPGINHLISTVEDKVIVKVPSATSSPTNTPIDDNQRVESSRESTNEMRKSLTIAASSIPNTPAEIIRSDRRSKSIYSVESDEVSNTSTKPTAVRSLPRMNMISMPEKPKPPPISQPVEKSQKPNKPRKTPRGRGRKQYTEIRRESSEEVISRPSTNSSMVSDDLLRKYCIIRRHRVDTYRNIFNKYLEIQNMAEFKKDIEKPEARLRRRQSSFYDNLYPTGNPTLSQNYVEDALRDILGPKTNLDDESIFEILSKPQLAGKVNFHTFCVLAALGETTSGNKLPHVRTRSKYVADLDEKVHKCLRFYDSMLGSNGDLLSADVKLGGFTDSQCDMVKEKLTDEDNTLSFLDFITYVPLFVHIHNSVCENPVS